MAQLSADKRVLIADLHGVLLDAAHRPSGEEVDQLRAIERLHVRQLLFR